MIYSSESLRIFIGLDEVEEVAYHVLCESIIRQTSKPVSITPVSLHTLPCLDRPWDAKQSNEFAFSRWLVPWLCKYSSANGPALWLDCDMLVLGDIAELFAQYDRKKAVQVVKHSWNPPDGTKFLGRPQSRYPDVHEGESRKLWSAVMLFNPSRCAMLTPEFVNEANGLSLHQFKWVQDQSVGELTPEWHQIADVQPYDPDAKLIHWTLGGPWWREYEGADYAARWREWRAKLLHAAQAVPVESAPADPMVSAR